MNFKEFVLLKEAGDDVETLSPLKSQGMSTDTGKSRADIEGSTTNPFNNKEVVDKITPKIADYFSSLEDDPKIGDKIKKLRLNMNTGAEGLALFYINMLYKMLFDKNGNFLDMRDKQEVGRAIGNTLSNASPFDKAVFVIVNNILRGMDENISYKSLVKFVDFAYNLMESIGADTFKKVFNKKGDVADDINDYSTNMPFDHQELVNSIFDLMNNDKNKSSSLEDVGIPLDRVADMVMGFQNVKDVDDKADMEIVDKHFPRLKSIGARFVPHKDKLYDLARTVINTMRHSKNLASDGGYTTTVNNINDAVLKSLTDFLANEEITPTEAKYILEIIAKYGGNNAIYAGSNTMEGGDRGNILSMVAHNLGEEKWNKVKKDLQKKLGITFDTEKIDPWSSLKQYSHGTAGSTKRDRRKLPTELASDKEIRAMVDAIANAKSTREIPTFEDPRRITDTKVKVLKDAMRDRLSDDTMEPLRGYRNSIVYGPETAPEIPLKRVLQDTQHNTVRNTQSGMDAERIKRGETMKDLKKELDDEEARKNKLRNMNRFTKAESYIDDKLSLL